MTAIPAVGGALHVRSHAEEVERHKREARARLAVGDEVLRADHPSRYWTARQLTGDDDAALTWFARLAWSRGEVLASDVRTRAPVMICRAAGGERPVAEDQRPELDYWGEIMEVAG